MIHRLLKIGALFFLGAHLRVAATSCSRECDEAKETSTHVESTIRRLNDIKATNLKFISQLQPEHESQRLKANSNIRIAEKRIAEAQSKKEALENLKIAHRCDSCAEG